MESDSDMRGIFFSRPRRDPGRRQIAANTAQVTGAGVRGSLAPAADFLYFIHQVRGELLFKSLYILSLFVLIV